MQNKHPPISQYNNPQQLKNSSSEQFLHKLASIMIERILDDMSSKKLLHKIQGRSYEKSIW